MPAKKAIPVEQPKTCNSGAMKWVHGLLLIALAGLLWWGSITIEFFFAILFAIIGIKILFGHSPCGCY
jgi:hypothetical protein